MNKSLLKPIITLLISINIYLFFSLQVLDKDKKYYTQYTDKIVLPKKKSKITPKKNSSFITFDQENKKFPNTKFSHPNHSLAKAGAIFTLEDKKILWNKNAKTPFSIASLTKILTILVLFDIIKKDPNVNLETKIPITLKAKKVAHSSFLKRTPYKSLSLKTLMHSIMFRSANDSAQLVADYFSKKYKLPFFAQMNKFAHKNKCKSARFYNPHGLPGRYINRPDNKISIEHLAELSAKIITEQPIISTWGKKTKYKYFSDSKKPYIGKNTNIFTTLLPSITGLKTGYTIKAGYCVILSWKFNKKTCVAILLGCQNKTTRNKITKQIFNWTNRFLTNKS